MLFHAIEGGGVAASTDCTIVFVQSWRVGSFSRVKNSTELRELAGVSQVGMPVTGDFRCWSRFHFNNLNLLHVAGAVHKFAGWTDFRTIVAETNSLVAYLLPWMMLSILFF